MALTKRQIIALSTLQGVGRKTILKIGTAIEGFSDYEKLAENALKHPLTAISVL